MDNIKTCIRRLLFLRKEFPWTGWFSCETIECFPSCLGACLRREYYWFWMSRCRLIETGLERCKMKKNASVTNNVRLLDVLFFPCSLPIRCDQLRLVGIWWIVKDFDGIGRVGMKRFDWCRFGFGKDWTKAHQRRQQSHRAQKCNPGVHRLMSW